MAGGVKRGFLITFEGPEGSGKSLQSQALADFLQQQGYDVVLTREPGGTALGQRLREALFAHAAELNPWAEAFLFLADRAQHTTQVLRPALERGCVVICDRYIDSTLAYQGFGRGLDLERLRLLNHLATGGLYPDLTILLDIDVQEGLQRRAGSAEWNHFDARRVAFHQRVRQGYLTLARAEPERWVVLSAQAPAEAIQARIRQVVMQHLARHLGSQQPRMLESP